MFSLHDGTLCPRKRDLMKVYGESFHGSFKRSKQGDDHTQDKLEKNSSTTLFFQRSKSESAMLIKPDLQLHLEAKTQSETFEDHRTELDLDLNLSSSSSSTVKTITKKDEGAKGGDLIMTPGKKGVSCDLGLSRSPSWLAFEGDDDNQKKQEMVTTVCMKCHMLVMLCKSTPVCPNCKFMHTDDHSSTKQFKTLNLFKLLC
ncbi:hypothetical protein CARUB_v10010336mg [Capsella rubella]|uniref:Uncharacterized protein n=1 Tax=Capsella rubella TaxID=81985 RepID=R0I884_9BRAS|nr:uncharacterized protein LOC17897511 [Capsella rubella]EOA38534.1 hypothetical protein CARUB_v10010336mg [Capsella rubella]